MQLRSFRFLQNKMRFGFTQMIEESLKTINSLKSRISGSSTSPKYDIYRDYRNKHMENMDIPGITIVRSKEHAEKVVKILEQIPERIHAWDSETCDLDVKVESPVGKGKIICASAFCGPDIDFGNGPRLFIDNFAQNSDNIQVFKQYLENKKYLKVWHNYSFDRHVFQNHGIDVQGFGGDTMHLARLLDPSLMPSMYSLANQTALHSTLLKVLKDQFMSALERDPKTSKQEMSTMKLYRNLFMDSGVKRTMTQIFGSKRSESAKTMAYPSTIQMHCNEEYVKDWVDYASRDADVTFFLFYTLVNQLRLVPVKWRQEGEINEFGMRNQLDIYKHYWQPFGEILTDIERKGFGIDIEHVKLMTVKAQSDILKLQKDFNDWVQSAQPTDQSNFNCGSLVQLQQLFYAPWTKNISDQKQNDTVMNNEQSSLIEEITSEQPDELYSDGRKIPVRKEITSIPQTKVFQILNPQHQKNNKDHPRIIQLQVTGIGLKPELFTANGLPSCDTAALMKMVGKRQDDQKYDGPLFKQLYGGNSQNLQKATIACEAVLKLIELRGLEVLLGTFISPLAELADSGTNRVHCSLNINTETGRLSSRKPNMQNQPALEKDRYLIRKTFVASQGNKLIVADYGQLELRVLAHMTNCKTMIEAFVLGGDFHSRTAISMYPYIEEEIRKGSVLLEWDKSKGEAPFPLLKEKYASERRKAKTMNFSIAYGKTPTGFAQEWGCSRQEAQKVINQWYKERKEVKSWQQETKDTAVQSGYTQTLIGRYRKTTKYFGDGFSRHYWHGLRAAINTPIQGGAADIVIAAMVRIAQEERLKELGWSLILQVHDELILEGPQDSAQEALQIVKDTMENPFGDHIKLKLKLEVDAKIGKNWYECK